jgi:hypothetical protein
MRAVLAASASLGHRCRDEAVRASRQRRYRSPIAAAGSTGNASRATHASRAAWVAGRQAAGTTGCLKALTQPPGSRAAALAAAYIADAIRRTLGGCAAEVCSKRLLAQPRARGTGAGAGAGGGGGAAWTGAGGGGSWAQAASIAAGASTATIAALRISAWRVITFTSVLILQVPMASNRGTDDKTAIMVGLSNHWLHAERRFRS